MRSSRPLAVLAASAALIVPVAARAQVAGTDSARADSARRLGAVVVTAERASTPLDASAAAVTRLEGAAVRRLPTATVAHALELVPGIAVLHGDAMGDAPRLAIRGFYGGGETEYVNVLLDGVPLPALGTGQIDWDLVPLVAIDAIEVVRGGASAAHGDAAVGGVVNLVTRRDPLAGRWQRWRLDGGSYGTLRAGGAAGGALAGRAASVFGDLRRAEGFRAHETRASGTIGGSLALASSPRGWLSVTTLHHQREVDDPGPLTQAQLDDDRERASPMFGFDTARERLHRVGVDGARSLGARTRLSGYLTGEHTAADAVRTVPLSVEFFDTRARAVRTDRALASLQLETSGLVVGVASRLVVGSDLAYGRLRSTYRPVVFGDSAAYAESDGGAGEVEARGRGARTSAALFANLEVAPAAALRLTFGARADRIADHFAPQAPSEPDPEQPEYDETHVAVSPRIGANLRWIDDPRQTGHVYGSWSRSFKAPTIDQLFDQRPVPVPFPPYAITTSNPALDPQFGSNVEIGAYHRVALGAAVQARLALSAYRMDMRDELDFSIDEFRYVNIGESRHQGVELGLSLDGPQATRVFANATRQDVTSRLGENAGNQLKAVPRDILAAGFAWSPAFGLGLGATATSVRGVFLDDANTRPLDAYTRLDLRATWGGRLARLTLNVRNALGATYSTTGFPDPGGSEALLFYPAAGRVVTIGVESGR